MPAGVRGVPRKGQTYLIILIIGRWRRAITGIVRLRVEWRWRPTTPTQSRSISDPAASGWRGRGCAATRRGRRSRAGDRDSACFAPTPAAGLARSRWRWRCGWIPRSWPRRRGAEGSHFTSMACIVTVAVRPARMSKCGYGQRSCHCQVARARTGAEGCRNCPFAPARLRGARGSLRGVGR